MAIVIKNEDGTVEVLPPLSPAELESFLTEEEYIRKYESDDGQDGPDEEGTTVTISEGYEPPPFPYR